MQIQKLAGVVVVALWLSAPFNLAWAGEGFERAFHAYHLAELGCRLWYSGASITTKEETLGRKACHIIESPLASMLKHRPEWWVNHEPKFLTDLEEWVMKSAEPPPSPSLGFSSPGSLWKPPGSAWNYLTDENSILSTRRSIARTLPPGWEPSAGSSLSLGSSRVEPFSQDMHHATDPQAPNLATPFSGGSITMQPQ